MSQDQRPLPNGNRQPPNNGARGITTAAGDPDPKKEALLERLRELRLWLDRKYAGFLGRVRTARPLKI